MNLTFYHKTCTADTRILGYFEILGRAGLLFSIIPPEDSSISDLVSRIPDVNDKNGHRCSGGNHCPLKKELKALVEKAQNIAQQVAGLSLPLLCDDEDGSDRIT